MNLCKKCKKPCTNGNLCEDCQKKESQLQSAIIQAKKILTTLEHGEYHYYIVNQTKTFGIELFHGFVWAPIQYNGRTCHHWTRVKDLKVGDKIFNSRNGKIEAISTVTKEAVVKKFPEVNINDPKYEEEGWFVECSCQRFLKPLELKYYMDERKKMGQYTHSPFDKNGDFCEGYLFPLSNELAELFETDIKKYNYKK